MKKKILFITYTHSLGGGAEKILTTLVNNLNPEKYEIDILEYAQYDVKEEPLNSNIKKMAPIVSMSKDNKFKRLWRNFQVYSYAGFLRKRNTKYDLEVSFNYLIPTFLLSKDVPTVSWMHGDIYDLQNKPYYRWLQRNSLKYVNKIIAISENTKQSICDVYPEYIDKVQMIYNGFNVDAIRKDSQEPCEIEVKSPSIAFVGRLEDAKNPLALLEVLRMLKQENKIVNLYYMGRGKLADEILARAKEYGIEEQVELLGYQKNPYKIMRQCSAMCMMSRHEGFPTVFAEGMALGIPFISSPVGGVKEMSNEGRCGRIVRDEKECAEAIKTYILNEENYANMKKECDAYIHTFDISTQVNQVEKLFDELLSEK